MRRHNRKRNRSHFRNDSPLVLMNHLTTDLLFPDVHLADANGLLAIGGDLSIPRLLSAYRKGIFPWFNEGEPILWWYPNPRCVLFLNDLKQSKSMTKIFNSNRFTFKMNSDFKGVIQHCKHIYRPHQQGTWITTPMLEAYCNLHKQGYAHSAECYENKVLVGGLYGVKMGQVFFGESMFSLVNNASKFAFISLVQQLKKEGIAFIDCQITSAHLLSLGAKEITAAAFTALLQKHIGT